MDPKAQPDFESGAAARKPITRQGFTEGAIRLPATSPATVTDPPNDPRLAAVIDAWDALPEAVRAGIAAMVAVARTSSETSDGEG